MGRDYIYHTSSTGALCPTNGETINTIFFCKASHDQGETDPMCRRRKSLQPGSSSDYQTTGPTKSSNDCHSLLGELEEKNRVIVRHCGLERTLGTKSPGCCDDFL